mgnify:FL=1|nr:MAG TPA: capsid protein [Caudoviricetes sp.]
MANYICRPVTEVPSYLLANFKVRNDNIVAGQFFRAERLTTSIKGNFSVYSPDNMAKADDDIAIILNNSFETLDDGRRPDGNPDYTSYVYKKDEVITGVRLVEGLTFELGMDSIIANQEVQVGGYLIPEVGENKLIYTETLEGIDSEEFLLIEGFKDFRVGGQFGSQFIKTMVVRVKRTNIEASTLDITATPIQGLEIPLAANTVVATLATTGGEEPYSYTLTAGLQDNDLFEIEGASIKNKEQVTEAQTYHVIVTATDNTGVKKSEIVNILIDNPSITAINITMTDDIREGEVATQPNGLIAVAQAVGGTAPYTLSLSGVNANSFSIDGMTIRVSNVPLVEGTYHVTLTATDIKDKTFDKELEIKVLQPYPEIESVTVKPDNNLAVPLAAHTSVADIQVIGGTAPYTITLPEGIKDNNLFMIEDSIKTKDIMNVPGIKHITIKVVDKHGKVKTAEGTIVIESEKPDIDNVRVYPVSGLKVTVAANTKVADIVTTGGSEPYTYTLPAGISNNDSFKISGSEVLAKEDISNAGSYAVMVKATDRYKKTKNSVTTAFTIAAE